MILSKIITVGYLAAHGATTNLGMNLQGRLRVRFCAIFSVFTAAALFSHGAIRAQELVTDKETPRAVLVAESAAVAGLSVTQIGDRVAYQVLKQRDFPPGYTSDIQLEALLAWGEASGQPGYLEFVRQVTRDRKFSYGFDMHSYRLQVFSCLPFEIYERFKNPEFIEPFLSETRQYRAEALRAYDGVISYYFPEYGVDFVPGVGRRYLDPKFTPVLIDNAQEYVSRLVKASALSKDPVFYQEAAEQLELLRKALRDPANGLWNHGRGWFESASTVATTKWGRAQAWILRGLVESLSYLPPGSREHQQAVALLNDLAQSLLRYQDAQGFWHQVVDHPDSYKETSATAFISYYFARAVWQGLLPEDPYREASAKAFTALTREKISADGVVYGTCERTPPLATVEAYLQRSTPLNDPHGVAAVLLSASGQLLMTGSGATEAGAVASGPIKQSANAQEGIRGMDAAGIQEMLNNGETNSVRLVRAYLERIEAYDSAYRDQPGVRAVVNVNKRALADAQALDDERSHGKVRGPLHGIPILIKDAIDVEGMPTTAGSKLLADLIAPDDAAVVSKLSKAGAIVIAKTSPDLMDTRNPFDQTKSAGFSSSGNGAGLAAGYAPLAIGEDTMGSIRIPTSLTSTVGFRPTTGLVSMDGSNRFSLTYDTLGPMTTTVRDAAVLLDVIAGYDPADPTSVKIDRPSTYTEHLNTTFLQGKRIGIFEPFILASDDAISEIVRTAAHDMEKQGATVVSIAHDWGWAAPPEVSKLLGQEMAGGYTVLSEWWGLYESADARDLWLSGFKGKPRHIAELAQPTEEITSADLHAAAGSKPPARPSQAQYEAYREDLKVFRQWFAHFMQEQRLDAIIYPTVRKTASAAGRFQNFVNTQLAPLLGYPAISIPAGFSDGMPVGIDIMGSAQADSEVLGIAYAYEQATHHRRLPHSVPRLQSEKTWFDRPIVDPSPNMPRPR
jgi:amidase